MNWHQGTRDIECTLLEGILTVKLSRALRMNAFTVTMAEELIETFKLASDNDAVKAIILTGEGKAFCAGMDLEGEGQDNVFGLNENLRPTLQDLDEGLNNPVIVKGVRDTGGRVVLAMFDCKKPLIAAINGAAVGVGATLTLPCDVRIASTKARFGFVFGKIGIVPDACASWFLPKVVGLPKALEWTLSGDIFDADTALSAGLVKHVVAPEQLLAEAVQVAKSFTSNRSPVSVALIRQMMYRNSSADHPLQAHKIESLGIFYTSKADGKEGVKAFLEKRDPQYTTQASHMPNFYPWWN